MMFCLKKLSALFFLLAAVPLAAGTDSPAYQRVSAVTHVHSNISPNGRVTLESIAALARIKKIDVLIPTDHFSQRWEYGVPPLPGLLRSTMERSSVLKLGPERYLKTLRNIQAKNPDLLVIPGLEVCPAYHWKGHLFQGNLTLMESQRHLLILGLADARDIRGLPALSNPRAGAFQWKKLILPGLVVALGLALMVRWPMGLFLVALGLLWGLNQRPFRRLPPAYQDFTRQGWDAAQMLIDYAEQRGALAVWAHPEASNWAEPKRLYRTVSMQTHPYPDALLETENYTGFAYLWEGSKSAGGPGGTWDQALTEYCAGKRRRPAWAFGELDWTDENRMGVSLTDLQNILWVREKTVEGVLEAFRRGRFYIHQKNKEISLSLDRWEARSSGGTALSGEKVSWSQDAKLRIGLSGHWEGHTVEVKAKILRNGAAWKTLQGALPLEISFALPEPPQGGTDFYRLVVWEAGTIATNPIFIQGKTDKKP